MKLTMLGSDARCFSKKFHSLGPQICSFTILKISYFDGNFLNKSENHVPSESWTSIFVSKLFVFSKLCILVGRGFGELFL